jgi:RNA polymerase sigma-70 factor (ECF subfamily)
VSEEDVSSVAHDFIQGPLRSRGVAAEPRSFEAGSDPDLELVDRWQAGDLESFALLVKRHERRVFRILYRMLGSLDEAADVSQETFLNLHRHGHRFRRESRFSTFVYRVAANAALNRRRTLGRDRKRLRELAECQALDLARSSPANPEEQTARSQAGRRIQEALLALPERLRLPLVLFDVEGLPYSEISSVVGIPEGTVKSRIHRARQALRDALGDLVRTREER